MSPQHHPPAEILSDYAAGALESGFALVVGAHLETCAQCRALVGAIEARSGAALAALPETEVAPDALARVLERLDEPPPEPVAPDRRPLLARLPLKRRRRVGPGVWVAAVDTPHDPDDRVYVLSAEPGARLALHRHSGREFCAVLRGGFRDAFGTVSAGDFALTEGEVRHEPVVDGDETCICLVATEGRLKAHGLIGKIAFLLGDV